MKKRLVAFLSFFQINLGTLHQNDTQLQCDCNLFDFATLISENVPKDLVSLLSGSKYPHTLLLSSSNFQMWKCEVNPVMMLPVFQESFLLMPDEYFICKDHSLRRPDKCTCYRGANDTRRILDCRNLSHTSLPTNIELSDPMSQLIINLEHNNIVNLPECDDPQYKWLKNVSTLNIQYNEITPKTLPLFDRFLRCMEKITVLLLAYNNIQYLPPGIQHMNFAALSISGNKLSCCNTPWMKKWLQEKNETIRNSLTAHCIDRGDS